MGALEVGSAAQVHREEESMSEINLQRLWAEGELREQATVAQVEARMGLPEGELKKFGSWATEVEAELNTLAPAQHETGEQLQLMEMRMVDLEQAEQERYERAIDAEEEVEEARPWGQVEEGWGQVEEVEERPISAVSAWGPPAPRPARPWGQYA